MAYQKLTRLWPVAMSKSDVARIIGCSKKVVERAVRDLQLPLYVPPTGPRTPRILTEDVVRWIRDKWLRS
jgi:hypothetical protein